MSTKGMPDLWVSGIKEQNVISAVDRAYGITDFVKVLAHSRGLMRDWKPPQAPAPHGDLTL
jgi:hypothetical protein